MKETGIGRTSLMLVACVILVAAACGGSDEGADVASLSGDGTPLELAEAADEEVDLEAALLEFTACMRENGVDLPDPEVDSEGNVALGVRQAAQAADIPREDMQAAFAECGDRLDGVAQLFERADITELEDQLLEFAQCMRDEGIDMPDPDLIFTPGDGDGPVRVGDRLVTSTSKTRSSRQRLTNAGSPYRISAVGEAKAEALVAMEAENERAERRRC